MEVSRGELKFVALSSAHKMACYALGNWLNYAINQFDVYTSLSGNTFLFSENISDCNETRGMAEVRGHGRTRHKQF